MAYKQAMAHLRVHVKGFAMAEARLKHHSRFFAGGVTAQEKVCKSMKHSGPVPLFPSALLPRRRQVASGAAASACTDHAPLHEDDELLSLAFALRAA